MDEIKRLQKLAGIQCQINEDTGTEVSKTVIGHTDDERDMIKKDLHQMSKYCGKLYRMIDDLPENADLPHWLQSKLVKAKDYISSAKHYIENELETASDPVVGQAQQQSEPTPDFDPSGVSGR